MTTNCITTIINRILITVLAILGLIMFPISVYADEEDEQTYDEIVVVIDAGHGGADVNKDAENGAMYYDELPEKTINLITAFALKEELERYNNVKVYMTREDDTKMSLDGRVSYANSVNADVMVCVHYNASEHHLFYGTEIFTSAFGRCHAVGNGLAECIMNEWNAEGLVSKGIKVRLGESGSDYYGVIRHGEESNLPVIILEHGYPDNHIDYARLGTENDWSRMGYLDATGIASYFGLSKDEAFYELNEYVRTDASDERAYPDTTPPTDVVLSITDIDPYNSQISYEISAIEDDGRLMYYGLALVKDEAPLPGDFADLQVFDGSTVSGVYSVPVGFEGHVVARVYNNYELYEDSDPMEISMPLDDEEDVEEPEEEESNENIIVIDTSKNTIIHPEEDMEEDDDFFFLGGRKADKETRAGNKRSKALSVMVLMCVIIGMIVTINLISYGRKITRRKHQKRDNDYKRR